MSNLKSLVAKANSGLSLRSKSKQRFGLGNFVAASVDQMLMTRGGYNPAAAVGGQTAQGVSNALGSLGRAVSSSWNAVKGPLGTAVNVAAALAVITAEVFVSIYTGITMPAGSPDGGFGGGPSAGYFDTVYR
jgi:hypothetical protein